MTFAEALDRKIDIDRKSRQAAAAVGMPGKRGRVDTAVMRELIGIAGYARIDQRDLELYRMPSPDAFPRTLVLDNELAVYRTGPEDVALRKSPTVKEMVSLRNIRKILYDSGAVVSKFAASVAVVHADCVATLDLTYTDADIAALADQGRTAVMTLDVEALIATVDRFAEILDLITPTPRPVQGRIWSAPESGSPWLIALDRIASRLWLIADAEAPDAALARANTLIRGEADSDIQGVTVIDRLAERVLQNRPPVRQVKIDF